QQPAGQQIIPAAPGQAKDEEEDNGEAQGEAQGHEPMIDVRSHSPGHRTLLLRTPEAGTECRPLPAYFPEFALVKPPCRGYIARPPVVPGSEPAWDGGRPESQSARSRPVPQARGR